jgi:hypothetical protein
MQARMGGYIIYSIPPTQLPLEVAAGSSRTVAVCIEGKRLGEQGDTLYLTDECGHEEQVKMATPVASLQGIGSNGCRSTIMVETQGAAKRTFIMPPAPNPVQGMSATVDLGLAQPEIVTLELLDMQGERTLEIMRNIEMPAGVVRIQFDITDLKNGAYFCRMTTASGGVHIEKFVVQR